MLNTIGTLSLKAPLPEQRSELARHARLIQMESQAGSAVLPDRERISRRCAELLAALENGASARVRRKRQIRETKKGLVLSGTHQDTLQAHFGDDVTTCFGKRVQPDPTPFAWPAGSSSSSG